MKEKKELSAEEIEAQIALELPDRFSKICFIFPECPGNQSNINLVFQAITIALGL